MSAVSLVTSYSWMMLGWRIILSMWISLATRSTSATSLILLFSKILTATCDFRIDVRLCGFIGHEKVEYSKER